MTPSNRDPPPDSATRRKSLLHCPDCGHTSSIDGDWQVEHRDAAVGHERVSRVCPDCGCVVERRSARLVCV